MKVSEVFNEMVGDHPTGFNVVMYINVETTTDATQRLSDGWSLTSYIKQYGDVEVEYDALYKVYRVPAFKKQRDSYIAAKAEHCRRWGSE
jgi:hypothetical protein